MHMHRGTVWGLFVCLLLLELGCAREEPLPLPPLLHGAKSAFDIHWPPVDPREPQAEPLQPLLRGEVRVAETQLASGHAALAVTVQIIRPETEAARQFWNSRLAFAEVPWMDEVRIWDEQRLWQWPNLPFLLRRHGAERVERYGGVDPGKGVDNDFAAVLIRQFDATGEHESPQTRDTPFVSAEWSGTDHTETTIYSVVHAARSERFLIPLEPTGPDAAGQLKVWLIYADFLGSRPPRTWPSENEWAGGILMYCEIDWRKHGQQACRGEIQFRIPPRGTCFDWGTWSELALEPARSKLSPEFN